MDNYSRNRDCGCPRCWSGRITGGAMMVTVGALFLLSEFSRWDFGDTWPVLLIVLGLIQVYRYSASTEGHLPPGAPPSPPPPPASDSSQVPHV